MKRLLLALCLALGLSAPAVALDFTSCDAVAAPTSGPCAWSPDLTGMAKITMTLYAVNVSTGLPDVTATSISAAVIEFKECEACPPIQFPKPGDPTINNIGGGSSSAPSRAFRLPPQTYKARWNLLSNSAGRITGTINGTAFVSSGN